MNNQDKRNAYKKTKKQVDNEKGFYSHLTTYIIINIIIIIFRSKVISLIGIDIQNQEFKNWLGWNTIVTPVLWGIGLFFHWLWVFKSNSFLKKLFNRSMLSKEWEERKIEELMNDDDFNNHS